MLNAAEQRIVEHVDRVGWSIMKVAPSANSDHPQEWFAYTIGLPKTFGWPEVICFGLSLDLMGAILNVLVAECRENGIHPSPNLKLANIIKNAEVKLVDATSVPLSYLNSARWFSEHGGAGSVVARLQMLWPDKNGVFPDEPDCEQDVRDAQTPLERLQ
jgi:hypothetical protein